METLMFTYKTRIFLHHTDAAGRLFFANQFFLIHEAKELFYESLGLPISYMLEHPDITLPVVHAESDYKAILVSGDEIEIQVWVEKIGETSVSFSFDLFKNKDLVGTGRTVCVAVDKRTGKKTPIPNEWRKKFEKGMV